MKDACEECKGAPAILYFAGRRWLCEGCYNAYKRELKKLQKAVEQSA